MSSDRIGGTVAAVDASVGSNADVPRLQDAPVDHRTRPVVRGGRRSLRRRVDIVLALVAALLVVMVSGSLIASSSLSDARERLADRLDPAAVSSVEFLLSLVDQESAVRGYALSSDVSFLEPWEAGQEREAEVGRRLRGLLADESSSIAALDELDARVRTWRDDAATPIADSGGAAVDPVFLINSKALFDDVRDAHAAFADDVQVERLAAREDLTRSATWLTAWLIALAGVLLACVVGVWIELRRTVLRPLAVLVGQTVSVADGHLDQTIEGSGAAEFRDLAEATDSMRGTIVRQLREVDRSRDELARSNKELEQFAYVASHDLQEPLRKVAAFCQMLQQRYQGQLDDRADQYIGFAVDGAKRMQELINDLLSFSRVGRSSDRLAPVVLDDAVARAQSNLSSLLTDTDAFVRIEPLPTVVGDKTLLVALFQNLIGNAVKFRDPQRPPQVAITVRRTYPEQLEFAIADNGIGIEPQYHDRVFVIFQRLHTREQFEGTGIGLAMCRKIVEFHGGRMWIDNDHEGPGTTFRFTLPARAPALAADAGDQATTVADESSSFPSTSVGQQPPGQQGAHHE